MRLGHGPARPLARAAVVAALVCASPPSATAVETPAFDCRYAKLASERAICDNGDLAALDTAMVALYEAVLPLLSDAARSGFQRAQTRWRGERDACGGDAACIAASYADRIDDLRGILVPGTPRDPLATERVGAPESGTAETSASGWCADFRGATTLAVRACSMLKRRSCNEECGVSATFSLADGRTVSVSGAEESYVLDGRNARPVGSDCWREWEGSYGFCFSLLPNPYMPSR